MSDQYFLQTLRHLRHYEEVVLFASLPAIGEEELGATAGYLATEYETEAEGYPYQPPPFDDAAAIWAAKTFYSAAQLLLYRNAAPENLGAMFPPYSGQVTPGAVLSADLTLRFMPDLLRHLQAIDPDDALIPVLEKHLGVWHYSAVGYVLENGAPDFSLTSANNCLLQLYADRIIAFKDIRRARHPALQPLILAAIGNHAPVFWNELYENLKQEHVTHR